MIHNLLGMPRSIFGPQHARTSVAPPKLWAMAHLFAQKNAWFALFCLFVHLNSHEKLKRQHWEDPQPSWHASINFWPTELSDLKPTLEPWAIIHRFGLKMPRSHQFAYLSTQIVPKN